MVANIPTVAEARAVGLGAVVGEFFLLQLWRTREELEEWPANLA